MNAGRTLPGNAAVVALTEDGAALARKLQAVLPGSRVHGLKSRVANADETFERTADHLRMLFLSGRPIVGVCAAGILIRALAPLLADKTAEPVDDVVAVSEDGAHAVPLLGGHAGANRIAEAVAEATGGRAAVTTTGDVRFGIALDDPPPGWRMADRANAKAVAAGLHWSSNRATRHGFGPRRSCRTRRWPCGSRIGPGISGTISCSVRLYWPWVSAANGMRPPKS